MPIRFTVVDLTFPYNVIMATIAEFRDVFAFSTEKMPGIPTNVMCPKLDIKPGYKPVKQKLRHQGKERIEAAKEEVEKLLKAGFIRECKYSDWLSNVVLVKKSNDKGGCALILWI